MLRLFTLSLSVINTWHEIFRLRRSKLLASIAREFQMSMAGGTCSHFTIAKQLLIISEFISSYVSTGSRTSYRT